MTEPSSTSGSTYDSVPETLRQRVFVAALDELAKWGLERFSIEAMTERHDIDRAAVYRYWGDRQHLVLDVLEHWSDSHVQTPDTGSLRGDVQALAVGVVRYVNAELGRRLLRGMVMDEHSLYGDSTRNIFWQQRFSGIRSLLDRARDRGELRDGVNPVAALQLLLAPIMVQALYTERAVDEQFGLDIADLTWRALASRPASSS